MNYQDYFALGRVLRKKVEEFLQRATMRGVVQLRNLARDRGRTFGAEHLDELAQGLDQAERRLVENHRPRLCGQEGQLRLPALFYGKESFETEPVAGKTRIDQRRYECRGSGQRLDLDARLHTGADEKESRIGDAGRTRIADQGDGLAVEDPLFHALHFFVFVELVVRFHPCLDVVVLEQDGTGPRVFGQDEVGFLQDADSPQRDVFQIADRRGNDIEFCHFFRIFGQKYGKMFIESAKNPGWIEVICGSMFSGKTEELIRRLKRAKFANQRVEIFKPKIDTRYSEEAVVSHQGNSILSTPVDSARSILEKAEGVDVVGIDEAQFFDEAIVDVARILAERGVRVIAAGLDMDYLGKPFGPMPALMATAEYVTKVHAICVRCGDLAHHSHRLSKSDRLVELGEKDIYEPVCRHCFKKLREQDIQSGTLFEK